MTVTTHAPLVRLSDTDESVAAGDEDIRGLHVLDTSGQSLGRVDALLVDPKAEKVRLFEVAHGGFLGMGRERSLIPVGAIARIDGEGVHLLNDSDMVAHAPVYDPELVETERDGFYSGAYGYFGLVPYWGVGYVHPLFNRESSEDPRRA